MKFRSKTGKCLDTGILFLYFAKAGVITVR